jgi:hypothetical protein
MSGHDDRGRTRYADGLRITSEHLEHGQALSLDGDLRLREALGTGRVAFGCRVVPLAPDRVRVEPGFAVDGLGRPLAIEAPMELELPAADARHVVLAHRLRGDTFFKGTPTRYFDEVVAELRDGGPSWPDGAVSCAIVTRGEPAARVRPRGEAYLPAPDHGHTGTFRFDAAGRWRYDGVPLGLGAPDYDSGPVRFDPGQCRDLDHGLNARDFLVMLEARSGDVAMNRGLGTDYWYEIHENDAVRVCRGEASAAFPDELHLRLRLYAPANPETPPEPVGRRPVADAGPDLTVDGRTSFTLSGDGSRAFGGRTLVKYRWTRQS